MKKLFLLCSVAIIANSANFASAQKVTVQSVKLTKDSIEFKVGEKVHIGQGVNPDGSYRYILGYFGGVVPAYAAGSYAEIIEITFKKDKYWALVKEGAVTKYFIQLDMALRQKELLVD